ncbi:uncharacterized protein LOC108681971 [Hyalella azteca]|uniref:Uncharacterized protein LOC108681971 n=1 Tax=Hyalella azteca TaxID=294128 RepID=A0A8B7PKM1_HYAAZ|nr:uncharacterized protein LOC108681971 [Hyalella azteca]
MKVLGVNLEEKSGAGVPKAAGCQLGRPPGNSCSQVGSKRNACIPLDPVGTTEREILLFGQRKISILPPRLVPLRSRLSRLFVGVIVPQQQMESPPLRISSWNVRTMRTGLSDDLRVISDFRKTAVIDRELHRLNVDIAALQETRLPEDGSLREEHYTFFWQGRGIGDVREHGVGFAVRNTLLRTIEPRHGGTERILTLRLSTSAGFANIICVYAPTLQAPPETKDRFYELLANTIDRIPMPEHIYLVGDFNARVGTDHESWPEVLGHHGIGKMNENGQRFLEFCCHHNFADCDTDHSLVISNIKIKPKKLHTLKRKCQPRIDASKASCPARYQILVEHLAELLPAERAERAVGGWCSLRSAIYNAAVLAYGIKERNSADWFGANVGELEPAISSKRRAMLKYKSDPSQRNLQVLRAAYSNVNNVSQEALDASMKNLPSLDALDAEPSVEELNNAIDILPCGKAAGEDGIPPEVIKSGKPALLGPLHELLCLCWREGQVPQDMRDAKIITLYKNKGDRSDCNNYRGISLLSIVGKVFARVVLGRLQALADRVYPESQCGFRAQRDTSDMIFSLRQLQEKCREQRRPLYIAFIDLTKAFDLVSRRGLFLLLRKIGCPPRLLSIVSSFHDDMQGIVSHDGNAIDT